MKIYDLFKLSLSNLWKRKTRTILTCLGVVIGTTSIVVMISIGVGLEKTQAEQIASYMDVTTIQVYRTWGDDNAAKLNEQALEQIRKIKNVKAATPIMNVYFDTGEYSSYLMKSGRYQYSGNVIALDISMMKDLGYELVSGRWPTENDTNVILFGENAPYSFINPDKQNRNTSAYDENGNKKPYPVDPFTKRITVEATYQKRDEVTGELLPYTGEIRQLKISSTGIIKGDNSKDYGQSFTTAYMDYHLYFELQNLYNKMNDIRTSNDSRLFDQVQVKANDMNDVVEIEKAIQDMGFETYSAQQIREQMGEMMKTVELVLGALGAVSMLVAAIGIANTMVMSIYERTREIGVMKVLGCKLSNIRAMFLVEAACIGMIGGIFGLLISHGLSSVVNNILGAQFGTGTISYIPLWLDGIAFAFAILVGVISGISPANRAVKISALSAIRQD